MQWSLLFIAFVIGILSALFSSIFQSMIVLSGDAFSNIGQITLGSLPTDLWAIFIPAIAGLIVGPLVYFSAWEARGLGVPEVISSVALKGGKLSLRLIVVKTVASAFSIGAGASLGRIGPIIYLSSGIGSNMARWFKFHEDKVKVCVACGAAAGISATFNAPIASVIFAQEVVLGSFTSITFVPIVIASVSASITAKIIFGDMPAFLVPAYSSHTPIELLFFLILGLLASLIGFIFVKFLYKLEDWTSLISFVPPWAKPFWGGLLVGLIGLFFPQVLGAGFTTIEGIFNGEFLWKTLFVLVIFKIFATAISLAFGHSGGIFGPLLFVGASLGGTYGLLLQKILPTTISGSGAYAIVGMGALLAAATQAPITAILLVFEMTRDYFLILPLMLTVVISSLAYSVLNKDSVYTLKLRRKGIDLQAGKDVNLMKNIMVSEIMSSPAQTVCESDTLRTVIKLMHDSKHNGFPVQDKQGELKGIITLLDIREAPEENIMDIVVSDIMTNNVVVTFQEETVDDVFYKMTTHDIGHLPVVKTESPNLVVGMITKSDILKAYEQKLTKTQKKNYPVPS